MEHPNFPIEELETYLHTKTESDDDINFGIAYVRKNYHKNQNLDEYLIDQDSISNYIANNQWILSRKTLKIASATLSASVISIFAAITGAILSLVSLVRTCDSKETPERTEQKPTSETITAIEAEAVPVEYQIIPTVSEDSLQSAPIDTLVTE